jgi:transketolase
MKYSPIIAALLSLFLLTGCSIVPFQTPEEQRAALEAAQTLEAEGIDVAVIRMLRIHPLPAEALESVLSGYGHVIFVEEASAGSGIGQAVSHCLRESVSGCVVHTVDLGSEYVTHGNVKQLYEKHGLDADSIAKKVREVLARED